MFRRVMVANRGEIAVRIMRTLREMGIASTAAFSDADKDAPFVQYADEAYRLGPAAPAQSYLNIKALISVARGAGVDAIHPGYGFLAENPEFAEAVADAGMTFIGPSPQSMRVMGDKVEARRAVGRLGVPLVPGTPGPVSSLDAALEFADQVGYPVVVKAAGGGGGRGIRVVSGADEMPQALESARREASVYFKNPEVYLEKYFLDPRHVEIQVIGDTLGTIRHLGERECSVQRRHQKLIEETPSPAVSRDLRRRMGAAAISAAESANYFSAGTVEFLLSREGEFYFLEMNTRLQVEHPATEMITGQDLVREMVLVAAGEPVTIRADAIEPDGHAIEVRVNAEDPQHDFRPAPAMIAVDREPSGIGVRVDSGVRVGYAVPTEYDSLLEKIIVWGSDREHARKRMLRALEETEIVGPITTIPFAQAILRHPEFAAGQAGTGFVAHYLDELKAACDGETETPQVIGSAARREEREFEVEVNRKLFHVRVAELRNLESLRSKPESRARKLVPATTELISPMHGTVIGTRHSVGDQVTTGETLFLIEAMKMENEVGAHRNGTITSIEVSVGDTVDVSQRLAVIE